jgi:hypothetical protein
MVGSRATRRDSPSALKASAVGVKRLKPQRRFDLYGVRAEIGKEPRRISASRR